MRTRQTLSALIAALALGGAAQAEMYNAQYLAPFAVPAAMNQDGTIVGWNPVDRLPFVVDETGYSALPCPKPYTSCDAVDVNDSGWIVGRAQLPGVLERRAAALWTPIGAAPDGPARYRFNALPSLGAFVSAEAIAIDNLGRILGLRSEIHVGAPRTVETFVWTFRGGLRVLKVPGPAVDLNDAGWVAGNAGRPYLFRLSDGKTVTPLLPVGFVSAKVHALGADGTLVGSMVNDIGLNVAAKTEKDLVWSALGGGGATDHLFGINGFGDVAGHVHGLDPNSHCGVQFADEGELKTIESLLHPRAATWSLGEAVAGPTDGRWIAGQAVNLKSGLPALVRLVPGKVESCDAGCAWVETLEIRPRIGSGTPGWTAVARLGLVASAAGPVFVDATWIHDGGASVEHGRYRVGPGGVANLTTARPSHSVQLYVTRIVAAGLEFDPTRGVLRAER